MYYLRAQTQSTTTVRDCDVIAKICFPLVYVVRLQKFIVLIYWDILAGTNFDVFLKIDLIREFSQIHEVQTASLEFSRLNLCLQLMSANGKANKKFLT
jgi:hypothetical protein